MKALVRTLRKPENGGMDWRNKEMVVGPSVTESQGVIQTLRWEREGTELRNFGMRCEVILRLQAWGSSDKWPIHRNIEAHCYQKLGKLNEVLEIRIGVLLVPVILFSCFSQF